MTTKQLIKNYARLLRKADQWKFQANLTRDIIAERILSNGSRATRYKVKESKVRSHFRRGYSAVRITV